MAKKTVELDIVNEKIIIKTQEKEIEYIKQLAQELDFKIKDYSIKGTNTLKATIMIAMELLNENKKLKALLDDIKK